MKRIRYCTVRGCDGRINGRAPDLVPLCASCRWLGGWALFIGGLIVGAIQALVHFAR